MNSLLKRFMVATLGSTMTLCLLSGCGSGSGEVASNEAESKTPAATETTASAEATPAEAEVKKPESIRWMVHSGMNQENGTDQWVAEFEKKTGIDLTLDIVSNNEYQTVLELAFASDTVPDVFDLNGEQKLASYAKQGAIADLDALIKGSELYNKVDKDLWEAITVDGKLYGIPQEVASGGVTYIRKDWLDRVGMEMPTTYDEFIEVLRAFKNNIEECSVPITAPGLKNALNLPEFYQDANPDFVKVDGKWVDGMAQDNMAAALQRMQDAYKEGLIDMEIVTNTTSACRDQWYAGGVGAFNYWGGLWGQTLTERLKVNVPDADVVAMDAIEGSHYSYSVPTVYCISSKLDDDKIASIYKYFLEYMYDGGEGQVLFQSGVENVHWKQDGNNLIQLPTLSDPNETFKKAWITPWLAIAPLELTDKNIELDKAVTDSLAVLDKSGVQKVAFPVSETLNSITSDLTAIREEILAKVVTGEMSVEDGMAKYRSESEMLNVAQVLKEMNE